MATAIEIYNANRAKMNLGPSPTHGSAGYPGGGAPAASTVPSTADKVLAEANAKLAQTKAQGSTPFAGSSYDTTSTTKTYPNLAEEEALANARKAETMKKMAVVSSDQADKDYQSKLDNFNKILEGMSGQQQYAGQLNTETSIVDALKSKGVADTSIQGRKALAESLGIKDYQGTADQNIQMLQAMKGGTGENKNLTEAKGMLGALGTSGTTGASTGLTGPSTGTPATTTTTGTTGTSAGGTSEQDQYTADMAKVQGMMDSAYQTWQDSINSIKSGSFPLSQSEQAQLDAINSATQRAVASQQKINEAVKSGYRMSEYAPEVSASIQGAIASAGAQKIAELEAKGLELTTDLRAQFQKNDYEAINENYKALTDILKEKSKTISDLHKEAVAYEKQVQSQQMDMLKFQLSMISQERMIKSTEMANKLSEKRLALSWAEFGQSSKPSIQKEYEWVNAPDTPEERAARQKFLDSQGSSGMDNPFGGTGTTEIPTVTTGSSGSAISSWLSGK